MGSNYNYRSSPFLLAATDEQRPILQLTWTSDKTVWVDQWPLSEEKLQKAHELVNEQLQAGHIRPSVSPWNTPIFVIPKKSGKWRLLQDLRKVNAQMQAMGPLQPGLPSPVMLPAEWNLLIIDLKGCFFTIPLHSKDTQRFAFTLPSINKQEPATRYEWVLLPQGMKNSPIMCQLYVSWALRPVRVQWRDTIIYHYMDDILCCRQAPFTTQDIEFLSTSLKAKGLVVAPEKNQTQAPWSYLGWTITDSIITPQKVTLKTELQTLTDVQTLLGDIQWVRNITGITNNDIAPLLPLLRGHQANKEITVTSEQKQFIRRIGFLLSQRWAARRLPEVPLCLLIINQPTSTFAVLCQWQKEKGGAVPSVVDAIDNDNRDNEKQEGG